MDETTRDATGSGLPKAIAASFVGTAVEWYDFYIYSTAAALVFAKLFFPTVSALTGTLAAFATLGVGFVTRPIGGVIFGHFGDRFGRKRTLIATLVVMAVSTVLVGLLPTYRNVGIAAPAVLVILRLIQGIGLGGEWGGGVLMATEYSPRERRGLVGALPLLGSPAGYFCGIGIFALLTNIMPSAEFAAGGWRIPFLCGVLLLVVGLYIRITVAETPVFAETSRQQATSRVPLVALLRHYGKEVALTVGARLVESVNFNVFAVFMIAYATKSLHLPSNVVLEGLLIATAIEFFTIPLYAAISDRIGRRPVYLAGAVTVFCMSFIAFAIISTGTRAGVWAGLILALPVADIGVYAVQAAFFSEQFPTETRYSGVSIAYQLSATIGGFTPLVATALFAAFATAWSVASLNAAVAVVSFVCIFALKETVGIRLRSGQN